MAICRSKISEPVLSEMASIMEAISLRGALLPSAMTPALLRSRLSAMLLTFTPYLFKYVAKSSAASWLGVALDYLMAHAPLDLEWVRGYSDYYPELPGGSVQGRAVEGETFDITNNGKVVARLSPVPKASKLEELRAAGLTRPAKAAIDVSQLEKVTGRTSQDILDDLRGNR